MTKQMNTAAPQLKIIISRPLRVQKIVSIKDAPDIIDAPFETNFRMAKSATAKLMVKMVSSFLSKYACWLATFSTSNLQTEFQTNSVIKTLTRTNNIYDWSSKHSGLSESRKQEQVRTSTKGEYFPTKEWDGQLSNKPKHH